MLAIQSGYVLSTFVNISSPTFVWVPKQQKSYVHPEVSMSLLVGEDPSCPPALSQSGLLSGFIPPITFVLHILADPIHYY
jgi:hypothetical protein